MELYFKVDKVDTRLYRFALSRELLEPKQYHFNHEVIPSN